LNGRWTRSKDLVPRTSRVTIEIDEDMDAIFDDLADKPFG
jgi:hypothetical protein